MRMAVRTSHLLRADHRQIEMQIDRLLTIVNASKPGDGVASARCLRCDREVDGLALPQRGEGLLPVSPHDACRVVSTDG